MAKMPLEWLKEFYQANGFFSVKTILLDAKTKYTTLGTNSNAYEQSIAQLTTSLNATSSFQDTSKDAKELRLTQEIKHECMKILRSFANTQVL